MPKLLQARPALDAREARQGQQLATSTQAPADGSAPAKRMVRRWDGARTRTIAAELGCHPQTVRARFPACNERGLEGLGMRPGGGGKPRLTALERSTIRGLVKTTPPGKPGDARTGEFAAADERGEAPAEWTVDTLTAAARARGSPVARRQGRCLFRREGLRWRRTPPWATSTDADGVPNGRRSSPATPSHRQARRSAAATNWAP
jgi:transposase